MANHDCYREFVQAFRYGQQVLDGIINSYDYGLIYDAWREYLNQFSDDTVFQSEMKHYFYQGFCYSY